MIRVSRRSTNNLPRLFYQQTMDAEAHQLSSRSEKKQLFFVQLRDGFLHRTQEPIYQAITRVNSWRVTLRKSQD